MIEQRNTARSMPSASQEPEKTIKEQGRDQGAASTPDATDNEEALKIAVNELMKENDVEIRFFEDEILEALASSKSEELDEETFEQLTTTVAGLYPHLGDKADQAAAFLEAKMNALQQGNIQAVQEAERQFENLIQESRIRYDREVLAPARLLASTTETFRITPHHKDPATGKEKRQPEEGGAEGFIENMENYADKLAGAYDLDRARSEHGEKKINALAKEYTERYSLSGAELYESVLQRANMESIDKELQRIINTHFLGTSMRPYAVVQATDKGGDEQKIYNDMVATYANDFVEHSRNNPRLRANVLQVAEQYGREGQMSPESDDDVRYAVQFLLNKATPSPSRAPSGLTVEVPTGEVDTK